MQTPATSNGFLPLAALMSPGPTAVGAVDLVVPLRVRPNSLADPRSASQLLLVRLHDEPVGVIALHRAPGEVAADELARSIWEHAGARIRAHVAEHRCVEAPSCAADLLDGLSGSRGCSGAHAARPPGRIAVIVATCGRPDVLDRALGALLEVEDPDMSVVVVDNRPNDGATREVVERRAESGRVDYVIERRRGVSAARNAGIAASQGASFVAFSDDDCVVDRHWLRWLLAPFVDPQVDCVTGMVMPLALLSSAQKRFELYAGFGKGLDREIYDLAGHRADDRLLYPFWGGMFGAGNSMAFRRDALVRIGGFDPALGAGTPTGSGEDCAVFTDILLAGGRLIYEPRSVCWHEHRQDEQALRRQVYSYGVGFTAGLSRYALRDPRFYAAAARSVPVVARVLVKRRGQRVASELPSDLARLELQGRLAGPWRYVRSRRGRRWHTEANGHRDHFP